MRTEPPLSPLRDHVIHQMRAGYGTLRKAIQGLTETQAREGADPDWQRYRWGSGLDGSTAGIVHHTALWKHLFAQGMESGRFPAESEIAPAGTDWTALCEWLAEGHARLERVIEPLSDAALVEVREWEGHREPLARLLTYLIEHDAYHAGQVELLRQLRGYPRVED